MPLCLVQTNLKESDIPSKFHLELSACVAKTLGKDEQRVTVTIQSGLPMCKAGSGSPCAILQIHSINVFDAERNPGYAPALYEFMSSKLKLPPNRIGVALHPLAPESAVLPPN